LLHCQKDLELQFSQRKFLKKSSELIAHKQCLRDVEVHVASLKEERKKEKKKKKKNQKI